MNAPSSRPLAPPAVPPSRCRPNFSRTLTTPVTVLPPSLSIPSQPSASARASNSTLPTRPPYRPEPDSDLEPASDGKASPLRNRIGASGRSRGGKGKRKAVAFVLGGSHGEGSSESSKEGDAGEHGRPARGRGSRATVQDIIQLQIRQPTQLVPALCLDSLLTHGIGDYSFVLKPASPSSSSSSDSHSGRKGPTSSRRVSLGKGKFSEVLLASKGDTYYALKHTPLHPHHALIATRLLREPTILAQLLPHPNLVQVFETIRTPGHFYLVEEDLSDSVTLEALVSKSAGGILDITIARSVLVQLASVIRSLHEPLRVCHRDIKPDNILVKVIPSSEPSEPPQVILKLLDFGLATHFSASEPKLTTCCGSPAYHSPELWRGLREPSGTVRYWGPEVDIWCLGLTLLRCLTPTKYPLGISHSSIAAISDKVVDTLLSIEDEEMRRTLAGFMIMSGKGRMDAFNEFCGVTGIDASLSPDRNVVVVDPSEEVKKKKEFKSTTFLPTEARHALDLPLLPPPSAESPSSNDEFERIASAPASRNTSRSRTSVTPLPPLLPLPPSNSSPSSPDISPRNSTQYTSLPPSLIPSQSALDQLPYPRPIELVLLNPTDEPVRRSASYVKYVLRCAGILYNVRSLDHPFLGSPSTGSTPKDDTDEHGYVCYLQCVIELPSTASPSSKASSALIAALRPPLLRAQTTGVQVGSARSTSTPPTSSRSAADGKVEEAKVEALVFYLSIRKASPNESSPWTTPTASPAINPIPLLLPLSTPDSPTSAPTTPRARKRRQGDRIIVTLSDARALPTVQAALRTARNMTLSTRGAGSSGESRGRKSEESSGLRSVSTSREGRNRVRPPTARKEKVEVSQVVEVEGLKMVMGEVREGKQGASGSGRFLDFVARFPGIGSRSQSFTAARGIGQQQVGAVGGDDEGVEKRRREAIANAAAFM